MTKRYVPKGFQGVLKGPAGGKYAAGAWFKATKDVDAEFATPAKCPITGADVLSAVDGKFTFYFPPDAVVVEAPAVAPRLSYLTYDIPESADIPNPSDRLRRVGIRVNLSVWVVPTNNVPYLLINELRAAGADVRVVKFDPSEAGVLIEMATAALKRDVARAAASAEASAEHAAEQYANSDKPTRGNYYESRVRGALKRAETILDDYRAAAELFGIDPAVLEIDVARAAAAAIQTGVYQRAEKYAAAVAALKAANTATATGLAAAAESGDNLPAGILADAIDDHGGDASELRAAFADDDVFSLADAGE